MSGWGLVAVVLVVVLAVRLTGFDGGRPVRGFGPGRNPGEDR